MIDPAVYEILIETNTYILTTYKYIYNVSCKFKMNFLKLKSKCLISPDLIFSSKNNYLSIVLMLINSMQNLHLCNIT